MEPWWSVFCPKEFPSKVIKSQVSWVWWSISSTDWPGSSSEPLAAVPETQNRTLLDFYDVRGFQSLAKPAGFHPSVTQERMRTESTTEENGSHAASHLSRRSTFFFLIWQDKTRTHSPGGKMCAADIKSRGQRNFRSAIRRFKVMDRRQTVNRYWRKQKSVYGKQLVSFLQIQASQDLNVYIYIFRYYIYIFTYIYVCVYH